MEALSPMTNEINPQEIFETMKSDFYKINTNEIPMINKEYIRKRRDLINFNHKITKKLGFKSQTFFLSIYYLDIIFIKNKNLYIPNFFLLGLSCIIIAAKFCENDPNVPPLLNFINIYNRYNIHKIGMKELLKMEVKILKYLNYNIKYVTSYDFNLFFFNHGIIKKQQIKDIINNNTNFNRNMNSNNKSDISSNEEIDFIFDDSFYIKKILEKIYKKSRYYLDLIISNENICFKYDALLISICIMKKSIEEVILKEYKLKFKDYFLNRRQIIKKNNIYFKEIMTEFYKIKFDSLEKYNIFMRDNDVINIFQRKEKEKEKPNLNIINQVQNVQEKNLYNAVKVTKINNNFNTINTETIKNNNNIGIKNKSVINLNNSMEHSKEKTGIKPNFTLYYNYINKNNLNNNKYENETENNSYAENIRNKYTFTQMKNNLKKDLSLRKKRCSDKYFHINNLKSLYKLASCANTIQNIKEGSLSKNKENNQYSQKKLLSNININSEDDNDGINNNIYYIKSNSKENIRTLKPRYKLYNESMGKKKELKLENIDNNKIRYNKVIITDNFHSKEKNKSKYKKTITESNNVENNQKPYFKKVIHNYEPMNKKIINKNNIKINIFNILSTSNNINDMKELENKRNFLTIENSSNNSNNYSQNKKNNNIDILKKRMDDIKKINKIRNMYNHKKLDMNIHNDKIPNISIQNKNNINNINNIKENKFINLSPKSNSKNKEINYINIINETNSDINTIANKVSTLENKSSYFKKKVFNSLNENQKNFVNNKYIIKQNTINSERPNEKFKNKLLLTNIKNKDNDSDIYNNDINELFKQKYNLQFHSKLFSTLTNNNNK